MIDESKGRRVASVVRVPDAGHLVSSLLSRYYRLKAERIADCPAEARCPCVLLISKPESHLLSGIATLMERDESPGWRTGREAQYDLTYDLRCV